MTVRIRALAMAGVFALACCGCQKGTQRASSASPDMAEAAKADAKAAGKTPKARSRETGRTAVALGGRQTAKQGTTSPSKDATPSREDTRSGVLTEADNGMEFEFHQGQTVTVMLDSNRSSGLSWALNESSGDILVPDGSASYAARSGKSASGTETWRFRAAKPGHQTVKLEYRRKWAQSMPERTFRFSGNVR